MFNVKKCTHEYHHIARKIKQHFESIGITCGRVRLREDGSVRLSIKGISDIKFEGQDLYIMCLNNWYPVASFTDNLFCIEIQDISPLLSDICIVLRTLGYKTIGDNDFAKDVPYEVSFSKLVDVSWQIGDVNEAEFDGDGLTLKHHSSDLKIDVKSMGGYITISLHDDGGASYWIDSDEPHMSKSIYSIMKGIREHAFQNRLAKIFAVGV